MIPAPLWRPSPAEYHELDGRWSSSMITCAARDPALAYARYVRPTVERDETSALRIGQAGHAILAGWPGPPNPPVMASSAKTARASAFSEDVERFGLDRIVVTSSEYNVARAATAGAFGQQTTAGYMLRAALEAPGFREYAIRFEVEGLPCKALIDLICETAAGVAVVDWKFLDSAAPADFRSSASSYLYHLQAVHLGRAAESILGFRPPVEFGVLSKSPPHQVAFYRFPVEVIDRAETIWTRTCADLRARLDGALPWSAPWEEGINDVIPASWGWS